jgi:hypothetical protein
VSSVAVQKPRLSTGYGVGYTSRQLILELGNLFEDEGPQVGPRVAARGRQHIAREPTWTPGETYRLIFVIADPRHATDL